MDQAVKDAEQIMESVTPDLCDNIERVRVDQLY